MTSHYPNSVDPVAGIFLRTQARALVRAGVGVDVVAPVPWVPLPMARLAERWDRYRRTPAGDVDEGVVVHRPRYPATPRQTFVGSPHVFLAAAARRALGPRKFDVVHGHYAYPEGTAGLRLGRALRLPVVLTLHGDDANTYPDAGPQARRRFQRVIAGADHVLAVSAALAERTAELTGRTPEVLPMGADLRAFDELPSRAEARRELGVPLDAFVVLFVGYLYQAKGVRELLAAMRAPALADALALFVGRGPLAGEIERVPNARGCGAVSNERVRTYLRAADVLALPSYGEGTPTVVVEAGAARLPVVATAVGGTTALLDGGRGLLLEPRRVDELARGLERVRRAYPEARARAEALRRLIESEHDADASARRLREIYAELTAVAATARSSAALAGAR